MKASAGWSLVLALTLTGCQAYRAAPVSSAAYPDRLESARLPEAPASGVWDDADILNLVNARNAAVHQAEAHFTSVRAEADLARLPPAGSLNLTLEYTHEASPWLYGLGGDLPLDSGVQKSARLRSADLAVLQAYYDFGEALWAVRMATKQALLDLWVARQQARLTGELVDLQTSRLAWLDLRVQAGEDDITAVVAARSDLAQSRADLADYKGQARDAEARLAQVLGVPVNQVIGMRLRDPIRTWDLKMAEASRRQAVRMRAGVLKALADYDLAEANLRREVAGQYPSLHLGPGYTWDHGLTRLPFNLSLVLPPADGNRAAIRAAESRRAEAGRALETTQADISATTDQALQALAVAQTDLDLLVGQDLPSAQARSLQADRSLAAGAADKGDVLTARAGLLDAQRRVTDRTYAVFKTRLSLEDTLRVPLDASEAKALESILSRIGGPK